MDEIVFALGPFAGAVVGGLISAVGGYLTNRQSIRSAESLSSTAYQRGVRDMRLAGLNPMLAFSQGGASTPTPRLENPLRELGEGVSSAARQAKLIKSQVQLNESASRAAEAAAVNSMTTAQKTSEETKVIAFEQGKREAEAQSARARVPQEELRGRVSRWISEALDKLESAAKGGLSVKKDSLVGKLIEDLKNLPETFYKRALADALARAKAGEFSAKQLADHIRMLQKKHGQEVTGEP